MKSTFLLSAVAVLVLLGLAVGVFFMQAPASPVLLDIVHSEVAVKIEVKKSAAGKWELLGTFKPTRENFHLYSKDLPRKGIRGIGRPTLMEVVSSSDAIRWMGELKAYQAPMTILYAPLYLSVPVYPPGAVELSLPFEWVGDTRTAVIELSVTYMACSDQLCLSPVMDKRFKVTIPFLR
jgi:hypothetical protein